MGRRGVSGAYARFWVAALLANVGDGIRLAAFPLLAASLTREPLWVAAVTAAQAVPWIAGGLAAGSLADRRSAGSLMIAADGSRILVVVWLIGLIVTDRLTVSSVVVAAGVLGVAEIVRDTAAQTVVPRLVPERMLERANGRLIAAEVLGGEFVGPPVGVGLFVVGAALPFAVNGATLALGVLLVASIPMTMLSYRLEDRRHAGAEVGEGVLAGLRWLRGEPVVRVLVVTVAAIDRVADKRSFPVTSWPLDPDSPTLSSWRVPGRRWCWSGMVGPSGARRGGTRAAPT